MCCHPILQMRSKKLVKSPRENSGLLVLWPFRGVTTEFNPAQGLRLRSAPRTAALNEPKAGLRNPAYGHQRDSPEAHCLTQHKQAFPLSDQGPTHTPPGPGSQEDPTSKPRVTQVFMLPDSKRALDAKAAGGWGGREQKEKSGLPRPSYLGSLNGFQIKAEGLPWTHSRRGCFPGNLLAPATGGKASPRSRAWQPPQLPQLVAWFTFPAQANPGRPSQSNRGTIHLQGPPPKRRKGPDFGSSKQGMTRTAVNHPASPCLLWGFGAWGLVSRQAAAPGPHQLMSGCPSFRTGQSMQANQRHLFAGVNTSCPCLSAIRLTTASRPLQA